jgi:hypothetical protein
MLTLFAASLMVIVLMLSVKVYEVSHNRKSFTSRIFSQFDPGLDKRYRASLEFYDRRREWALLFLRHELPRHSRDVFTLLRDSVYDKYRSVLPNIRGMRVLRSNREASPFLQDIKNHKEREGVGRIEE